jgi:hypothetical protein
MLPMFRLLFAAGLLVIAQPGSPRGVAGGSPAADAGLPRLLRDTGLYAPGPAARVRDGIASFSPQYPLWSDGAGKRRWLYLPPGASIDASSPDAWEFPPGTKLWKEFAYEGRPVETRHMELEPDGKWRFGAYVWNDEGTEAVLAPAGGIAALPVAAAPQGRYAIPSRSDCLACHGSTTVPVLGLTALQLSPDRDPMAAGGRPLLAGESDLRALVARGWVRGLPRELLERPPRIPASGAVERAALGYLHGNCAHCHNTTDSRVPLQLTLAQRTGDAAAALTEVLRSAIAAPSRYRPADSDGHALVVAPGKPADSVLAMRMQSRHKQVRMPPLGTSVPDADGLALVHRWILSIDSSHSSHPKETTP